VKISNQMLLSFKNPLIMQQLKFRVLDSCIQHRAHNIRSPLAGSSNRNLNEINAKRARLL